MQSYSLTEIRDRQNEVLNQAAVEPVFLTEDSRPGYVIMSAENYRQLIERLAVLEDCAIGQLAENALKTGQMVGTEKFVAELNRLANADSSEL